ncbi:hypothetical protein OCU04_006898 [Sclerotinia nivalis]|uniref:Uncharacterized protein n=1 Tax=Sclerotinia nivalis TaxID=352851 RepID=A0A9X0ALM5_9HELO|nr:hypothetical protein OCU04_006898 [Sclerotinia nivalis]
MAMGIIGKTICFASFTAWGTALGMSGRYCTQIAYYKYINPKGHPKPLGTKDIIETAIMTMWFWRYGIPSLSLASHMKIMGAAAVYGISERIFGACREQWNKSKKTMENEVVASKSGK